MYRKIKARVASAKAATHAKTALKEDLPQFIGTVLIDTTANDKAKMMITWIPSPATEILRFTPLRVAHERA